MTDLAWSWSRVLVLDLDVDDSVLDSVSSLNDSRAQDETISKPPNASYIMIMKYFCEFIIFAMFRK